MEALTRPWVPLSFLTSPKGTLRGLWTRCPSPLPESLGLGVSRASHPVQAWTPGRKPPSWPAPGPTCASREEPKSGVRFQHQPDTARSEVRTRGGGAQEVRRRPPGGLSGGGSDSSRTEGRAIWQGAALQLGAGHGIGGQNEGGKPAVPVGQPGGPGPSVCLSDQRLALLEAPVLWSQGHRSCRPGMAGGPVMDGQPPSLSDPVWVTPPWSAVKNDGRVPCSSPGCPAQGVGL